MRRMQQSRGLLTSLEEEKLVVDEKPTEHADNANSMETDLVEVTEAEAEQAADTEQVEEAAETAATLEAIADSLDVAAQNGGIDKHAAAALEHAVDHLYRSVGLKNVKAMPALESFGGSSSRIGATTLALEDIREQAKKIWDAIIEAINKSIAWIKEQFGKIFGTAQKLEKRAAALAKRAGEVDGQPKEKTFENERLVKALFQKGGVPSSLAPSAQAVKDVADTTFNTFFQVTLKTGEAIAELMETEDESKLSALEAVAGKPQGLNDVPNPESEGFQTPAEGISLARSIELPGGKALVSKYLASNTKGETALKAFKSAGTMVGDFSPKSKAPEKNTLNVLATNDAAKTAEIVEGLAQAVQHYQGNVDKINAVKEKIKKAAAKLGQSAAKEDDAGKRDFKKSLQAIGGQVPRLLDQPAFGFSVYALNTGKALLDAVEESLKQYAK